MSETWLIVKYLLIAATAVTMIFVLRARRRQHGEWLKQTAEMEVCEHLRPALSELMHRGHSLRRAELVRLSEEDLTLEIHVSPGFDAQEVYAAAKLEPPALVSERNVLYCKECWREIQGQD